MLGAEEALVDPLTGGMAGQILDADVQDMIIRVDKILDIADALLVSHTQV